MVACAEELLSFCFSFHRLGPEEVRCELQVLVSILLNWVGCRRYQWHCFVELAIANIPDPSLNLESSNACDRSPSSSEPTEWFRAALQSDASAHGSIELGDYCLTFVTNCICSMH